MVILFSQQQLLLLRSDCRCMSELQQDHRTCAPCPGLGLDNKGPSLNCQTLEQRAYLAGRITWDETRPPPCSTKKKDNRKGAKIAGTGKCLFKKEKEEKQRFIPIFCFLFSSLSFQRGFFSPAREVLVQYGSWAHKFPKRCTSCVTVVSVIKPCTSVGKLIGSTSVLYQEKMDTPKIVILYLVLGYIDWHTNISSIV